MPGAFPCRVWLTEVPPETPKTSLSCKEMKGFPYFPFPSFSRFRRPGPTKMREKRHPQTFQDEARVFLKKGTPTKSETSSEKAAEKGAKIFQKSSPGSPATPHGHPIAPGGSHDPPGRIFGHPCGTVFEHFANHFGPCGTSFATKSVRHFHLLALL